MPRPAPSGVPSPCVSVCRMRADGYCEGCLRTLDEIARWGSMSDPDKRRVWKLLPARRAAIADDTNHEHPS